MSEWFVAKCPDAGTLSALAKAAAEDIRGLEPHLKVREIRRPGLLILAALNERRPFAAAGMPGGLAAVMGNEPGKTAAETAAEFWDASQSGRIDGAFRLSRKLDFGAGLALFPDGELILTTDYLGLYPMFVHSRPDMELTVCASMPRLIRLAPGFRPRTDPVGIVSGLLVGHHLLGHTLWSGARRLGARTVLCVQPGGKTVEDVCPLPEPALRSGDFREHLEFTHAELSDLMAAYVRGGSRTALVSGGLDSRMIAGYLAPEAKRLAMRGFTFGDTSDTDARFALKAMRESRLTPTAIPVDSSKYVEWAEAETRSDGAESGLYTMFFRVLARGLAETSTPVLSGLLGDPVLGASHDRCAYDGAYGDYSFDALWEFVRMWGLPPRIIRKLVRDSAAGDIVQELIRAMSGEFDSYPGEARRKAVWFDLHHRQRLQIGRMAKLMAIHSWPALPFAHYRTLALAASLPFFTLAGRRLQLELTAAKFPRLAALPLDRNGPDKRSVAGALRSRVPWAVRDSWHMLSGSLKRKLGAREDRFYYRMFSLDSPGWREVRTHAGRRLGAAAEWIDAAEAARLIPDGSTTMNLGRPIEQGAGRKALMAVVLWLAEWAAGPEAMG